MSAAAIARGAAPVATGALLAALFTRAPMLAAATALGVASVTIAGLSARRVPGAFLGALAALLFGYVLFGRGFAYLGHNPIFIGEAVLALGLLSVVSGLPLGRALRSAPGCLLLVFAGWCCFRTVPYLAVHGVDALRDGVLWGYSVVAILVAACVLRLACIDGVARTYARALPIVLVWLPIALVVAKLFGEVMPRVPGSTVPMVAVKPGDVAVHLAGAAAFLGLGVQAAMRGRGAEPRRVAEWMCWGAWTLGCLLTAALNRGGMLTLLFAFACTVALRPSGAWLKAVAAALCLGCLLVAVEPQVNLGTARVVSTEQIAQNFQSIWSDHRHGALSGTKSWRLDWWSAICDYTLFGDYFWEGKGFGINLADSDGFQVDEEGTLRSPHNSHLTVLARAGVPGLVLWILLQASFAMSMLRARARARARGEQRRAVLQAWILVYWASFMVNAAFDVFLEGPQGGIWFWAVFGLGLATIAERDEVLLTRYSVARR